jgi:hypothetical protein
MTNELNGSEAREESLERLYMELTGASESAARNVFMHVCCEDVENGCPAGGYNGGHENPSHWRRAACKRVNITAAMRFISS